jgi:hypothetical protein
MPLLSFVFSLLPEACAVLLATLGAVLERGSVLISAYAGCKCAHGLYAQSGTSLHMGVPHFLLLPQLWRACVAGRCVKRKDLASA